MFAKLSTIYIDTFVFFKKNDDQLLFPIFNKKTVLIRIDGITTNIDQQKKWPQICNYLWKAWHHQLFTIPFILQGILNPVYEILGLTEKQIRNSEVNIND